MNKLLHFVDQLICNECIKISCSLLSLPPILNLNLNSTYTGNLVGK